jgi:uroporphyrinogen-III synthase
MSVTPLVLVTRTESAGETSPKRLPKLGKDVLHCAPFALEPPENAKEVASQLEACCRPTWSSLPARKASAAALNWWARSTLPARWWLCPERVRRLARELGFANVIYPSRHGTSEAMLALPELREVDGLNVLILAAEGGRGLMGKVLEDRGAVVDRIHVYRRIRQAMPG